MARVPVDPQTAQRLIEGRLPADDLPPGLDRVAEVLAAARRSATDSDFSRMETTVAAMAAAVGTGAGQLGAVGTPQTPSRSLRAKFAVGSVAGLVSLFGGLAAAGALPAGAQNGLANAVAHVGIDLPAKGHGHGHGHGNPHGNQSVTGRGYSHKATKAGTGDTSQTTAVSDESTVAAPPCPTPPPDDHGQYVSGVAQSTPAGADHGKTVSAAARSDCGKPTTSGDQPAGPTTPTTAEGPEAPGDQGKPPTNTSDDHGKPATTPTTAPGTGDNGGSQGQGPDGGGAPGNSGAHGGGH
jgi:hypothetical protein